MADWGSGVSAGCTVSPVVHGAGNGRLLDVLRYY